MSNPNPLNQFKPGTIANPKGRPKKEWTWGGLIRDIGNEYPKNSKESNKKLAIKALWGKANKGDVQAIKELGNRLDGMPVQKQEVEGNITVIFHNSLEQDETESIPATLKSNKDSPIKS